MSAFVLNAFHPPGHLLSLLIVVSMTLSASICQKGFRLDNCIKNLRNINCSLMKGWFVGKLRSSPLVLSISHD